MHQQASADSGPDSDSASLTGHGDCLSMVVRRPRLGSRAVEQQRGGDPPWVGGPSLVFSNVHDDWSLGSAERAGELFSRHRSVRWHGYASPIGSGRESSAAASWGARVPMSHRLKDGGFSQCLSVRRYVDSRLRPKANPPMWALFYATALSRSKAALHRPWIELRSDLQIRESNVTQCATGWKRWHRNGNANHRRNYAIAAVFPLLPLDCF